MQYEYAVVPGITFIASFVSSSTIDARIIAMVLRLASSSPRPKAVGSKHHFDQHPPPSFPSYPSWLEQQLCRS